MFSLLFILVSLFSLQTTASTTGRVRLVGQQAIVHSGIVEVFITDKWLPILYNSAVACSENEGNVICRQLGFESLAGTYKQDLCSVPELYITEVLCAGTEVSILECEGVLSNETAEALMIERVDSVHACAVSCANLLMPYINSTTSELSLYYNNKWYPVCSDSITEAEVNVICHELGFNEGIAESVPTESDHSSAIYLDANCTGYEFSLKQCQLNDKEIQIVQDCMAVSFLSCYGFTDDVCPPLLSSTSCNTVNLTIPAHGHYYYIRYRTYDHNDEDWIQTAIINDTSVIINDLLPQTAYQFNTALVGMTSNSTPSATMTYITNSPKVQGIDTLTATNITSTQLTLTWKLSEELCSSLTITSFEIQLKNSIQIITVYYTAYEAHFNAVTGYYIAQLENLTSSTRYSITVRAIGKVIETAELLYGPFSDKINITTQSSFTGAASSFLSNPTLTLVLLILLILIVVVTIVIGGILCLFVCGKKCHRIKRKKKMRTSHLYCDTNVYITGDLSDQSYIPMTTRRELPVSDNPVTLINTRRRTSSIDRMPDSYWINFPSAQDMTTFAPLTEETENEVVITDDQLLTTNSTTILLEDDDEDQSETDLRQKNELTTEENDHPYDEIPGAAKKKQDLVIANTFTIKSEAVDSKKEEEEEEEDDKVYDEIPPPMTPDDSSNTSQGEDLPPYLLTLSQEPNELTPTFLPPPKEFADLPPQRRPGTITSPIYLQAKTHSSHKRHRSFDSEEDPPRPPSNTNNSPGSMRRSDTHSLRGAVSQTSALSRGRSYTSRSVSRLDVITNPREGERDAYYDIPTTFKEPVAKRKESLPNKDSSKAGEEYEILVHPALTSSSGSNAVRRHKRPPPPVPSHPPSAKVLSVLKTQDAK